MNNYKYLWLLDFGHGGIDPKTGIYQTEGAKQYHFNQNDFSIYEGDINRKIGLKLACVLGDMGMPYQIITDLITDTPLSTRVKRANVIFQETTKYLPVVLSIHSNAASISISGEGSKATGNEIYTSRGETNSDKFATVFAKTYKRNLSDFRFRQDMTDGDPDKEADFYVLRKTAGPAVLFETLFYDNYRDASFLTDPEFQYLVAMTIAEGCSECEQRLNIS